MRSRVEKVENGFCGHLLTPTVNANQTRPVNASQPAEIAGY
jgi:hypothetical protein